MPISTARAPSARSAWASRQTAGGEAASAQSRPPGSASGADSVRHVSQTAIGIGAAQTHRSSDLRSKVIENPSRRQAKNEEPGLADDVAVQDQRDRDGSGSVSRQIDAGAGEPEGAGGRGAAHGLNLATPRGASAAKEKRPKEPPIRS